jgi:hypothetical protein
VRRVIEMSGKGQMGKWFGLGWALENEKINKDE